MSFPYSKSGTRARVLDELQADILRLEGFKSSNNSVLDLGLGPIKDAFPNATFPLGAIHEFLIDQPDGPQCRRAFFVLGTRVPLHEDWQV